MSRIIRVGWVFTHHPQLQRWFCTAIENPKAPIAQLDRALPSEGRGHWFESSWVHHIFKPSSENGYTEYLLRVTDTLFFARFYRI